jgi:hypothetical protein
MAKQTDITNTEKSASNFELNVIKLGIHTFQLQKGDRFESNGHYFHYCPSTAENKGKGAYTRYSGRSNNISCKKYEKDVLRADNIELISDKPLSPNEPPDSEYNQKNRMKVWEVKYAYKMELPKNENIVLLSIEMGGKYSDDESKKQWQFKSEELTVKRVTAENYFLENSCPIGYHSQIPKKDLNNVRVHYGQYYVLCLMDDYNDMELELFKFVEAAVNSKIATGHDIVRKETDNLNKFLLLKSKQGY